MRTIYDPASGAQPRFALRLPAVDVAIGYPKALSRAARCRLIAQGKYPRPIFSAAGHSVVLTSDILEFLERARERAPEQAVINAEKSARMVAARQAKRAQKRETAGRPDIAPGSDTCTTGHASAPAAPSGGDHA